MKALELNQMEKISGEGCGAYLAGIALIVAGGVTANPALGYVGLVVGVNNAESCASTVSSWF